MSDLGKKIKRLRTRLRLKGQAEFASLLDVTQPRVSAWEGGEPPTCEALAKLGNLAIEKLNDAEEALFFWKSAGLKRDAILATARKISRDLTAERMAAPPEGKIVAVRHRSGGAPWYVD